ncbi:reverse transcriptase domain-containing protein [Tanacetum coccineum]
MLTSEPQRRYSEAVYKLQDMGDILKETTIEKTVLVLQNHVSKDVSETTRTLIKEWKDMALEISRYAVLNVVNTAYWWNSLEYAPRSSLIAFTAVSLIVDQVDMAYIISPRMRTQSAGRPAAESLGGGMYEQVGRGRRGRRPREGNDELVEDLNGQGNDQGLGANGGVEGVNENVEGANGGLPDFSRGREMGRVTDRKFHHSL